MLEFTHTTLRSCKPPPHDAEHYSEGGGRVGRGEGENTKITGFGLHVLTTSLHSPSLCTPFPTLPLSAHLSPLSLSPHTSSHSPSLHVAHGCSLLHGLVPAGLVSLGQRDSDTAISLPVSGSGRHSTLRVCTPLPQETEQRDHSPTTHLTQEAEYGVIMLSR